MYSETSIRTRKVHNEEINNELGDLHGSQVLLPLHRRNMSDGTSSKTKWLAYPNLRSSSSGIVVVVHQHMDAQVDGNRNPLLRIRCSLRRSAQAKDQTYDTRLSIELNKA